MTRWLCLLVVVLTCAVLDALATVPIASAQAQSLTLNLVSQNNSGISGTATLTDLGGGRTRVVIQVTGAGTGPEPAHIHPGSCAQLDPTPAFTLASVANGSSTTEVDNSLQQLTSKPYAVHLHKSPDELTVYVACADIAGTVQPGVLPRSGNLGDGLVPLVAGLLGLAMTALGLVLRTTSRRAMADAAVVPIRDS
jgi:Cu/Zn superoxide dismutase